MSCGSCDAIRRLTGLRRSEGRFGFGERVALRVVLQARDHIARLHRIAFFHQHFGDLAVAREIQIRGLQRFQIALGRRGQAGAFRRRCRLRQWAWRVGALPQALMTTLINNETTDNE